jgi:hypothetical protein
MMGAVNAMAGYMLGSFRWELDWVRWDRGALLRCAAFRGSSILSIFLSFTHTYIYEW